MSGALSPRLLGGAVVTAVMPSLVAALLPLASLSALVLLPGSSWDIDEACFPSTAWERRVARLVSERAAAFRASRKNAGPARAGPRFFPPAARRARARARALSLVFPSRLRSSIG